MADREYLRKFFEVPNPPKGENPKFPTTPVIIGVIIAAIGAAVYAAAILVGILVAGIPIGIYLAKKGKAESIEQNYIKTWSDWLNLDHNRVEEALREALSHLTGTVSKDALGLDPDAKIGEPGGPTREPAFCCGPSPSYLKGAVIKESPLEVNEGEKKQRFSDGKFRSCKDGTVYFNVYEFIICHFMSDQICIYLNFA